MELALRQLTHYSAAARRFCLRNFHAAFGQRKEADVCGKQRGSRLGGSGRLFLRSKLSDEFSSVKPPRQGRAFRQKNCHRGCGLKPTLVAVCLQPCQALRSKTSRKTFTRR